MASSDCVIELDRVTVRYGDVVALRNVSLRAPGGAMGLAGRNGAGKSTLLRILLGLIRPQSGAGHVLGLPIDGSGRRLRQTIGYVPDGDALIPGMKGIELVTLAGELCGLHRRHATIRAHETFAYVGLGEARYRPIEQYSTGMRQRLKLAAALVHDPQLLLLDEPTVGLDPPGRADVLRLLADLVTRHGKSILLSTHLLADIEETCQNVVILEAGEVMLAGPIDATLQSDRDRYAIAWEGESSAFPRLLEARGAAIVARPNADHRSSVFSRSGIDAAPRRIEVAMPPRFDVRQFFHAAREAGVRIVSLETAREDLSSAYHRLLARRGDGHER